MIEEQKKSQEVKPGSSPAGESAPRHRRPVDPPIESIDTFAIEDEPSGAQPVTGGEEPTVFGGRNPENLPTPDSQASAMAPEEELLNPSTTVLEEALQASDLLGEAPRLNFHLIVRSTAFLISALVVVLLAATVFIYASVPTETYVQTDISFVNYDKLDDLSKQDLQLEINKLIRTYPVRAEAWDSLQKRKVAITPGFLNSGLTFHRLDSLVWDPKGTLRIRVDSDDPANDVVRLAAVMEAFHNQAQSRNVKRDQSRKTLAENQQQQLQLLQQDAQLKAHIDALLEGALDYIRYKAALQATERYLELADESNPLRLVAKQNLKVLVTQVSNARGIALERDDDLAKRIAVQKKVEELTVAMTKLRTFIDTFAFPTAPDSKNISIYDSRPHQRAVLRYTWLGLIAGFAGLIVYLHWAEHRVEAVEREERRERRRQVSGAVDGQANE